MDLTLEEQERLLLTQQRRGHASLRFSRWLEEAFVRDRFRFTQRHWGLAVVVLAAVSFQLVYAIHDLLTMPLLVGLKLSSLRLLSIVAAIGSGLYYRRRGSDPVLAHWFLSGSYLISGLCVVLLIYFSRMEGQFMPYEGLLLLLLFGYALVGLPFRTATYCGWLLYLVYLGLGLAFNPDKVALAYELLFLGCLNLIGSTGSYLQEHAHRDAWINLRLLKIARHRTERDSQSKLRLLTAVSHDLRQPLNAMGLYAQHLQESATDPEVRRISGRLNVSVEQLGRMLQSLLDYNRLSLSGAVQVHLQSVALAPMLTRLQGEAQAHATGAAEQSGAVATQLSLACGEYWVRTDPLLLERLLRNLISNALRHAGAGNVWLRAEEHDGVIRLEVGDDGCGLSVEDQELVFEEFRQLGNPGRNSEQGLGLGLSIVRQLAALLGHSLQLLSSPGEGTRFILELAVAEPVAAPKPAANSQLSARILLLEDDRASREALTDLLQRWGCQVRANADLGSALAEIEAFQPQLLISDFRLAGQEDGLDAIEQMRKRAGQMLPALLVSADASSELQTRSRGFDVTLLGKPLLPARLRQTLGLLLANEQARQSAVG
jgi:signal transduction histidine kinase/CheY-like chemotaxis protein